MGLWTLPAILIVEDEFLLASMLEGMLQDLGCHDVVMTSNLAAAFEALKKFRFDVVVLDVNLDGTPSEPMVDHLLAHSIPFIFSTGYDSGALAERWRATPFLQKPYTSESLNSALESTPQK